jgi:hypothetical protein
MTCFSSVSSCALSPLSSVPLSTSLSLALPPGSSAPAHHFTTDYAGEFVIGHCFSSATAARLRTTLRHRTTLPRRTDNFTTDKRSASGSRGPFAPLYYCFFIYRSFTRTLLLYCRAWLSRRRGASFASGLASPTSLASLAQPLRHALLTQSLCCKLNLYAAS